jgi:16S rRNA (guanine966-N2)-methyltransferase
MSPANQRPSSLGAETRKQRPPQSTQTISSSGSTPEVCPTRAGEGRHGAIAHRFFFGAVLADLVVSRTLWIVRVVAGSLRGRTFAAPEGRETRPTTDRTREAVFNALTSLDALDGAVIADLFAGSGALGIEALSRGAARCTFIEADPRAVAVIRDNVRSLGLDDRSSVLPGRVETAVRTLANVDVVLADPPYGYDQWRELLERLEPVVGRDGIVVIESGREIGTDEAPSDSWDVIRSKRYGRTWVAFLQRI